MKLLHFFSFFGILICVVGCRKLNLTSGQQYSSSGYLSYAGSSYVIKGDFILKLPSAGSSSNSLSLISNPDSISVGFNYNQKTKLLDGSCSFDGNHFVIEGKKIEDDIVLIMYAFEKNYYAIQKQIGSIYLSPKN